MIIFKNYIAQVNILEHVFETTEVEEAVTELNMY